MKNFIQNIVRHQLSFSAERRKQALILSQFFLIIFVYHILKDLKDTLVITSSEAGAQVIPFLKIWVILPFAILSSFIFSKIYQRWGREKTFYFFVSFLVLAYVLFAFVLYPLREELYLQSVGTFLRAVLPVGCKGFISMVSYWIYTFFYLAAELWAMMILTVLFWGYLNETTNPEQAKSFYPLCVFAGNCAGILSGQISRYLCHDLAERYSWEQTLQMTVFIVAISSLVIIAINRRLSKSQEEILHPVKSVKKKSDSISFKESIRSIFHSQPLVCIAVLVVGFGLTSNLIEVVWKGTIKEVYPQPQAYNAYVGQLTSIIGSLAVVMSLLSRVLFRRLSWSSIALFTPVSLFITSFAFFFSMQAKDDLLTPFAALFHMEPLYLVMTIGSIYYILALTAKYTIFDMCKEMAFLSIPQADRMRAKAVIDSVGSRLGKSGSSCLYQMLLVMFGSTAGCVPLIGCVAVAVIGISVIAAKRLGRHVSKESDLVVAEASLS